MTRLKEKAIRWSGVLKEKLLAIRTDRKKVSMGYAFGVFLASTPFIGIKVFIAIPFIYLFKWSKAATIIGVFHINAFTGPFFYGLSFLVGKKLLGTNVEFLYPETVSLKAIFTLFTGNISVFYSLLLGGLILGIPMAIGAYWLSMRLTQK
jgi:hypothetical protein